MAIAITLKQYLDGRGVPYELRHHDYASSSQRTAEAAHVPGRQLAKPVIFRDTDGFVMAVIPADRQVDVNRLRDQLHRPVYLAHEAGFSALFKDCALGAVPPVGQAYGMPVVWDESLEGCGDVFFEAGDHTELVRMSGRAFGKLMSEAPHGSISRVR
ncbi:MAG TPA: YbaK/EbsC family protein [Solimonas sp.]|nr:YbaK/EbsC family protein [Solimonas sp.]